MDLVFLILLASIILSLSEMVVAFEKVLFFLKRILTMNIRVSCKS